MKRFLFFLSLIVAIVAIAACSKETVQETSWADRYTLLLQSGKADKGKEFAGLAKELAAIREELGNVYVYAINPIEAGKASITGSKTGDFMLMIDGSDPAEEWGVVYEAETQFAEAWGGRVATARSAWNDDTEQRWSVFAPIINKDKQVVAVLGIDSLVTDVMAEHSEWNRDNDNWNGYTDDVPGGYPVVIQEKLDELTAQVSHYAEQLSATTR